ncbi:MAG: hypothetical protein IJH32_06185 [Ruminococcus sp.]|nr:hypothetical protein [Ruminococcus sp.]
MKTTIKNAFKETPPRFHYSIRSSINEATTSPIRHKNRISRPLRIIIAAALILAIIPSAVFGASKLYGLLIESEGAYGVRLKLSYEADADYPEYVKMVVNPPAGFETRPNLGEEKYCRVGEEPVSGFSIALFRFAPGDDISALEKDVAAFSETVMNGHRAYLVTPPEGYGGWDRLFIYYEYANVTVLLYYHDVTQNELEAFVAGISFVEGTEDDHTYVATIETDGEEEDVVYEFNEVFKEFSRDTVVTYAGISEEGKPVTITSQISDIRYTENISLLDADDFNSLYPYDEIADENGDLLPKTVRIVQEGDGIETPSVNTISTEEADQVMVLADITYTNKSDEDTLAYVNYWMNVLNEDGEGGFSHAEVIDREKKIFADAYCDTERTYQSEHGDTIKGFYSFPLGAGETKTVTVGFRCNRDELEKAYLVIYNDADIKSVGTSEDLTGFNRCIFKVK